jgi:mannose-6-phosphate isomerase-like protein (cupin superfamily)
MAFKLSSVLILGSVLSLAGLVGSEVAAQVVAAGRPAAKPAASAAQASAAAATPAAQPPAVHLGPEHPLDKVINPFAMERTEKSDAGYVYWFFDKQFTGNGKTLKLSVVRPHEASHPHHHHVEDEFWFVLEGKAEFYIDGKTRIVGPNTGVYAPSNVEHGIKNAGDTELRYLVIKQYPDVGATK